MTINEFTKKLFDLGYTYKFTEGDNENWTRIFKRSEYDDRFVIYLEKKGNDIKFKTEISDYYLPQFLLNWSDSLLLSLMEINIKINSEIEALKDSKRYAYGKGQPYEEIEKAMKRFIGYEEDIKKIFKSFDESSNISF